jgi:hypothetical protein
MGNKIIGEGLIMISILWNISCEEYEPDVVVKSIPEQDRFIFDAGNHLFYSCSDGSTDTVRVSDVNFYTHSFSEEDWFGILRKYRIDHGKITREIADTSWLKILHYACYNPGDCNTCVNIETDAFENEWPTTHVYFGCEEFGGLVFATGVASENEIYLSNRRFTNVYSWSQIKSNSDFEGFRMHWSLKYGIIRFEGEIGETLYSWDLIMAEGE